MKTIELALQEITPYENNPRNNDNAVDAVAKSIHDFGFQQPLVLDKNKVIIVGHTRYKAALKLGLETVPCVIADNLTEEKVRAYRLADNKVGELASWDQAMLEVELGELDIDMTEFGFVELSDIDVDGFFEDAEPKEEDDEPEEDEEIQCPHCKMWFKVN
jgi:ParB/RepB/Spo0J family partition protein